MKTFLKKVTLPCVLIFFLCFSQSLLAQPMNDDCADAFPVTIAVDEASCVPVDGSTVGATGSTEPSAVCSGTWFGDDIWFSFTTGATLADVGYVVKSLFGTESGDVPSVGMAVYESCGVDEPALQCFSTADPETNSITLYSCDLSANHTYYVRVWSTPDATTNSGTLRLCVFEAPPFTDIVLWGDDPGEGDFDGGLNGWTTVNDGNCPGFDLWRWSESATANDGAFANGAANSNAPTACNGAMAFDSDFYDNNGDPTNLGGGDCPAVQIGELISPTIDLSAISTGVSGISLKFHQLIRQFQSNFIVSYSNNDGADWFDILINTDFPVNSATVNEFETVFLPEADLSSTTFKIKFRFEANYYFWVIDDVQLIESAAYDLSIPGDFYAIAPNTITPVSQVEPYSHLANVFNGGAAEQTNVNLNITIVNDTTNTVVFTEDNPIGTIPPNTLVTDQPFQNFFTPDGTTPSSYTATYEVSADSMDVDPSNNTQTYKAITSDTVFAKEFGPTRAILPAASNWDPGEPHSWAYGNYFYVVDGDNWDASSASFMIGNADDPNMFGRLLVLYLYRWDGDTNEDGEMDPDERTRVGFGIYEIQGNEPNSELLTVPLLQFPTGEPGPIDIESGQAYVLMLEYLTNDQQDLVMMAGEIEYNAMIARSGAVGSDEIRYASLLGIDGDLDAQPYSTVGFGTGLQPVVRLNIAPASINIASVTNGVSCFGECDGSIDLTITGTSEDLTFDWTGPDSFVDTTEDISGLCAGFYQVIVTSASGSTEIAGFIVDEPDALTAETNATAVSCFGECDGSIDLSVFGGTAGYSYSWSNGSTNEDPFDLCPGTYTVTITDANGCSTIVSETINDAAAITAEFETTVVPCTFPCQNGIDMTPGGGTPPLSFQWFDGDGTPISGEEDIINVCPDTYTVIITDFNGCTIEFTQEIEDPGFPAATSVSQNASCFGVCDGEIDLEVTGGAPPYTYSWSGGLPPTEDQTGVCAGSYFVTITDSEGCTNVIPADVTEPSEVSAAATTNNPSCFEACDGSAVITTTGGTPPYTVAGPTDDLCAGDYMVTVTDVNGCTVEVSFTIAETPEITVVVDAIIDETDSMMNGAISITASGGTPPFTYSWSVGGTVVSTDEDPTGLSFGIYELEVTDANGCVIVIPNIVVDNIVGTAQLQLSNSIRVFPNPTSGELLVEFKLPQSSAVDLEIFDFTGRLLDSQALPGVFEQNVSLDMSRFIDGVYTLKIKVDDVFVIEKIVKYSW